MAIGVMSCDLHFEHITQYREEFCPDQLRRQSSELSCKCKQSRLQLSAFPYFSRLQAPASLAQAASRALDDEVRTLAQRTAPTQQNRPQFAAYPVSPRLPAPISLGRAASRAVDAEAGILARRPFPAQAAQTVCPGTTTWRQVKYLGRK